ncbi:MAG TPA: hypothetical protein EYP61_07060 [Candidatus Latescibacteria bacterium]|nr:hypothetical protein [Candidatus Latescibacterota bacterium]
MATVQVLLKPDGRKLEVEAKDVRELLGKLGIREGYVLVIDTTSSFLLTPDERLSEGQRLELRRVISGG